MWYNESGKVAAQAATDPKNGRTQDHKRQPERTAAATHGERTPEHRKRHRGGQPAPAWAEHGRQLYKMPRFCVIRAFDARGQRARELHKITYSFCTTSAPPTTETAGAQAGREERVIARQANRSTPRTARRMKKRACRAVPPGAQREWARVLPAKPNDRRRAGGGGRR